MNYGEWSMWGMHIFWWVFWIVMLVVLLALFSPLTPVQRGRRRETPLEVLQRRYAAGEISTEDYEERKAKLERDAKLIE